MIDAHIPAPVRWAYFVVVIRGEIFMMAALWNYLLAEYVRARHHAERFPTDPFRRLPTTLFFSLFTLLILFWYAIKHRLGSVGPSRMLAGRSSITAPQEWAAISASN